MKRIFAIFLVFVLVFSFAMTAAAEPSASDPNIDELTMRLFEDFALADVDGLNAYNAAFEKFADTLNQCLSQNGKLTEGDTDVLLTMSTNLYIATEADISCRSIAYEYYMMLNGMSGDALRECVDMIEQIAEVYRDRLAASCESLNQAMSSAFADRKLTTEEVLQIVTITREYFKISEEMDEYYPF